MIATQTSYELEKQRAVEHIDENWGTFKSLSNFGALSVLNYHGIRVSLEFVQLVYRNREGLK